MYAKFEKHKGISIILDFLLTGNPCPLYSLDQQGFTVQRRENLD